MEILCAKNFLMNDTQILILTCLNFSPVIRSLDKLQLKDILRKFLGQKVTLPYRFQKPINNRNTQVNGSLIKFTYFCLHSSPCSCLCVLFIQCKMQILKLKSTANFFIVIRKRTKQSR